MGATINKQIHRILSWLEKYNIQKKLYTIKMNTLTDSLKVRNKEWLLYINWTTKINNFILFIWFMHCCDNVVDLVQDKSNHSFNQSYLNFCLY